MVSPALLLLGLIFSLERNRLPVEINPAFADSGGSTCGRCVGSRIRFIDPLDGSATNFNDHLLSFEAILGRMTKATKSLHHWVYGVVILEAALSAILYSMHGDASTEPRLLLLLFAVAVNLPGMLVASWLGLFGNDPWGQNSQPMPGWAVVIGVSVLCYTCCIRMVQFTIYRKQIASQDRAEAPDST